jgi:ferredoxin-NADP reductase
MEEHVVKIMKVENITHDVKHFVVERPQNYHFEPGQATEVSINKPDWKNEKRPFTFTGLKQSENLEFVIKVYPDHNGVTAELGNLKAGDELNIRDVWGAITYKGPGVFIAGGAGITPFISIFRQLHQENSIHGNKLIFSNKTASDIILKDELDQWLGKDFINVLTRENVAGFHHGRMDRSFLQSTISNFKQHFYICGPEQFVEAIREILIDLGAAVDAVVIEK